MTIRTDHNETKRLLARFLDGETSLKEEQRLYKLMRRSDLPDELARYRDMMGWFENGLQEKPAKNRWRLISNKARIAITAAASIAVAIGIYTAATQHDAYSNCDDTGSRYFICRNGVKITDLDIVMPEIERAETLAASIDREYELQMQEMEYQIKNM